MIEKGYSNGDVQCVDCLNMESYWKDGELAFFMCKTNSVTMKKLERRWRKCKNFSYIDEPALNRRNNIK